MSASPPKADMCSAQADVRLVPEADIGQIEYRLVAVSPKRESHLSGSTWAPDRPVQEPRVKLAPILAAPAATSSASSETSNKVGLLAPSVRCQS